MPVHEGHRSRKKEQFRAHGLDAFADHESTLDIAVDSRDRILVADPARMQIRVFVALAEPPRQRR